MSSLRFRYVAVEGPIGVGKTSFVDAFARRINAERMLEDTDNPFLNDFYRDRPGAAFQAQLFFLLIRHKQQLGLRQGSLFRPVVVSDYVFSKDRIFANLNLTDDELLIYDRVYEVLEPQTPKPELVIYLQASTEVLLHRISLRRREIEMDISPDYVEQVNEAYRYFFYHYRQSPLLVIDTTEIDFVKKPKDLDELVRQIDKMESGTQYFIPPSSRDG